jgi:hypothetical protein
MTNTNSLIPSGIYDSLLDHSLQQLLTENPDLRAVLDKIDAEEQPARYSSFVAKLLEQALREESAPENRLALCNRIIEILSDASGMGDQVDHKLVPDRKSLFHIAQHTCINSILITDLPGGRHICLP